ncbi:hypothetical protein ABFT80_13445 [Mesorhizobium sp. SB112]|uniref:hypothetical protein n=1 Tax=Mesorhizobium sp. SB112 TaxID=3151853 RepID=UPI003263BB45
MKKLPSLLNSENPQSGHANKNIITRPWLIQNVNPIILPADPKMFWRTFCQTGNVDSTLSVHATNSHDFA